MSKHPMQKVEWVDNVIRFRANPIVRDLLDQGPLDLNQIGYRAAEGLYSDEDQEQFAQLIGYSVSGFSELSYVSDKTYEKAEKRANKLLAKERETNDHET